MPVRRYALAAAVVLAIFVWGVVSVRAVRGDPPPLVPPTTTDGDIVVPATSPAAIVPAVYDFEIAALRSKLRTEHARLLAARRRTRALTRTLAHRPSTQEAISLACAVYGSCSTLWRRADCESHLYPLAHNSSGASGLFQFLPSTFSSTPFASLSIFSPYANALAAGWMIVHGRGGEWSCR